MQDILDGILAFLRNNLTDPHPIRTSNWIYHRYPKIDLVNMKMTVQRPRVSLIEGGATRPRPLGIGEEGFHYRTTVDVDIWCDTKTICTISSVKYSGSKLAEKLAKTISQLFIDNRSYLYTNYGIVDAIPYSPFPYPYDEDLDLHRITLTIDIEYCIFKTV